MLLKRLIIALVLLLPFAEARYLYYGMMEPEGYIDMPAAGVVPDGDAVVVGRIRIARFDGPGDLVFDERTVLSEDTIRSVLNSAAIADDFTGRAYNYYISYDMHSELITGESSGAAIALGMVLLDKGMQSDALVIGSLDERGMLEKSGGLPLKIVAAREAGISRIFIAPGQMSSYLFRKVGDGYLGEQVDIRSLAGNATIEEAEDFDSLLSKSLKPI